jgi:hypothetical protein
MDFSFADYIIYKYSVFLDPFSITEINTEQICYPVSYASEETLEGLQSLSSSKDCEDDMLIRQSIEKDLSHFDESFESDSIPDGASHILKSREQHPFVQLLGMPKIGKTSLLRKLALQAAYLLKSDPNGLVPLLVSCEVLLQQQITCKMEMIELCFSQFEEFEAYLREKFFQGKIILLLDEAEKVQSLGYKLVDWILALKTFVNVPLCVISSRYFGYLPNSQAKVLLMDLYPVKLQVSMGQCMLSELQYERFIEKLTENNDSFSDFANTPFLLSLLLEMFRWGIVGTEDRLSRGRVYALALRHLLRDFDTCKHWQSLELLAADLLLRDVKLFNLFDIKNLDIETVWNSLRSSELFIVHEDSGRGNTPRTSEVELQTESFKEYEIGDIKETPIVTFISHNKDSTPKWIANSKESYINYQIAKTCLEKDIFHSFYSESFRFVHLRFAELLAAEFYVNQVEDSLLQTTSFHRAFTNCLPGNFLFCRRYREVLLFFSALCSENIFENFVKYLLNKNSLEHLYVTSVVFRERGFNPVHRPLLNKFKQDWQETAKKNFAKGFASPCAFIRQAVQRDAREAGVAEEELAQIVYKNIDAVLKTPSWLYLKQINHVVKDSGLKIIKSVFLRLMELSLQIINCGHRPATSKVLVHKRLMMVFISAFDKNDLPSLNQSFISNEEPRISEEATIRISFDKLKIPRSELGLIEKLGSSQKMIIVLEELVQGSPGIDINSCVRILLLLGLPVSRIHTAIACRFESLHDTYEKKEILKVLKMLGFVTQHTIDIPLICLGNQRDSKETKVLQELSKDILKLLNVEKLKKHAIGVLTNDESTSFKILLALRAMRFIIKFDLDEEVVFLLVQFIDHYSLELRYEAIFSLYKLLKRNGSIEREELRKTLAATPHVLRDRLKLLKYDKTLRIVSLKCLTALWIALDKGKIDTKSSTMLHILVKEHISSSFLVGSPNVLLSVFKDFFTKSSEERLCSWKCLNLLSPSNEFLKGEDLLYIQEEISKSLSIRDEQEKVLEFIQNNSFSEETISFLTPLMLDLNFDGSTVERIFMILSSWNRLSSLKNLIPTQIKINPQLGIELSKVSKILSFFPSKPCKSIKLPYKQVQNWYKGLINQIAENIQWPSKMFPHSNQLLDISADPSFFQNESLPDICPNDLDSSLPKVSLDSMNSDSEEPPPPVQVLFELVQAGIRSDGLKYWVLWYLKNSSNVQEYFKAASAWRLLTGNKEFYNPQAEGILVKMLAEDADNACQVVECLNFKSDSFALKIIDCLIKGKTRSEVAVKALAACLELNTSTPLEEVLKMLWITGNDTEHFMFLNETVAKVIKTLVVANDAQMNSLFKALGTTECPLLVQPVWEYAIKMIRTRPGYLLPMYSLSVLEFSNVWEAKFLISQFRILGLVPVDPNSKESGSSMSTKRM